MKAAPPITGSIRALRSLPGLLIVLLGSTWCDVAGPSGPVTWGTTVTVAEGGWGRMIQLANGSWLCVSTVFPGNSETTLNLYRSSDNGRTWQSLSSLSESGRTLDNGELVALPNGDVLLTMRSLIDGQSYRLPVYRSTDNGRSWFYLSTIDSSQGLGSRGLWEPDFWVLDDGRLVVTYSNETHDGYSQLISLKASNNQGTSWSKESWAVAEAGGGSLRPGMSQMTRMANGQYLLVYELVGAGNADVHYKTSDNGLSWPEGLGTPIPCQHCGPFVTAVPDGRVFVTSCENQVSYSDDFARTWQKIDPPAWDLGYSFSWPAVYPTRSTEIAVMAVAPSLRLRFGTLTPPTPWPNPFTDDFDQGTDLGWTRYGGDFAFENGHYLLNNSAAYGKALVGDSFWTDGTLEADVMLTTATGDAGLLFRVINPDYVGPDDAFGYYVGLRAGGSVFLGKMDNTWQELAASPAALALNTWHHLRIDLKADTITVTLDDLNPPSLTATDNTHMRGQIGVRAFHCNAQFDNVSYTSTAPLRLDSQLTDGQLHFSWPQNAFRLQLSQSPALHPAEPWAHVTNTAVLSGGKWNLVLPEPTHRELYYRLNSP